MISSGHVHGVIGDVGHAADRAAGQRWWCGYAAVDDGYVANWVPRRWKASSLSALTRSELLSAGRCRTARSPS